MHFAKLYAAAAKDLPEEWQPYLISYKALKKCIGSIVKELEGRGLSVELLKELRERSAQQPAVLGSQGHSTTTASSAAQPPERSDLPLVAHVPERAGLRISEYQQVLVDTDRQKLLYTFSDSSHPCLVVIVNDPPDALSADHTPPSTAPASPTLSACAPAPSEECGCLENTISEVHLAHVLADRLDKLRMTGAEERRPFMADSVPKGTTVTILEFPTSRTAEKLFDSEATESIQLEEVLEDHQPEEGEQPETEEHLPGDGTAAAGCSSAALPEPAVYPPVRVVSERPSGRTHAPGWATATMRTKFGSPKSSDELTRGAGHTGLCVNCAFAADRASLQATARTTSPTCVASRAIYRSVRKRRPSRRVYATIYADDGQTVKITRTRRADRGRFAGGPGDRTGADPVYMSGASLLISAESCDRPVDVKVSSPNQAATRRTRAMKVTLRTDVDFFTMIISAITRLGEFQAAIKERYEKRIRNIADLVATAANPQNGHTSTFGFGRAPSDMYTWREIMATFAAEEIWFDESMAVIRCDTAKLEKCQSRLGKWERLASERCFPKLKLQKSRVAFGEFLRLNRDLLAMKQFRELNKMAIGKILKKHDKRTLLTCRAGYEGLLAQYSFIHDSLTQALCYAVATHLLTIVPQPQDYNCPVCMSISWKPIRLKCGHVFCVRCLIKAQRRNMTNCPLCRRSGSVAQATADNLDVPLMNLLRLYFPKEIKEKRKENAKELVELGRFF